MWDAKWRLCECITVFWDANIFLLKRYFLLPNTQVFSLSSLVVSILIVSCSVIFILTTNRTVLYCHVSYGVILQNSLMKSIGPNLVKLLGSSSPLGGRTGTVPCSSARSYVAPVPTATTSKNKDKYSDNSLSYVSVYTIKCPHRIYCSAFSGVIREIHLHHPDPAHHPARPVWKEGELFVSGQEVPPPYQEVCHSP